MLDKLAAIEQRYDELSQMLMEVGEDYQRAAELNMERTELEPLVKHARQYRDALQRQEEAEGLLDAEDEDLRVLAEAELAEMGPLIERLEKEIKSMLLPSDKRDQRNVIMEIRAGTGGDEAALFAADLFRMYNRYAERHHWQIEVLSANEIGIGGYKEIIFLVKGRGAYSRLKYESGVHRVQRVPVTESQGRIHTGMVVACQDERSQLQNRIRAMSILRARLYEIEEEKQRLEQEETRRSQVGSGERSEKIRTYNYPQSRVTDHRINVSSYNLPAVMDGDIDTFIDELATRDEAERLATVGAEA
jgi:peptide chain release factor 1